MDEIYKGYEICAQANDFGYYVAESTEDAIIIVARTIKELKIEIDELKI